MSNKNSKKKKKNIMVKGRALRTIKLSTYKVNLWLIKCWNVRLRRDLGGSLAYLMGDNVELWGEEKKHMF